MTQYISKSALVAEINKLKNISLEYGYTAEQRIVADVGKDLTLKGLLDYIDTLEASNDTFIEKVCEWLRKEVEEDYVLCENLIKDFKNYMKE